MKSAELFSIILLYLEVCLPIIFLVKARKNVGLAFRIQKNKTSFFCQTDTIYIYIVYNKYIERHSLLILTRIIFT